jgi:hypothetical protein
MARMLTLFRFTPMTVGAGAAGCQGAAPASCSFGDRDRATRRVPPAPVEVLVEVLVVWVGAASARLEVVPA